MGIALNLITHDNTELREFNVLVGTQVVITVIIALNLDDDQGMVINFDSKTLVGCNLCYLGNHVPVLS